MQAIATIEYNPRDATKAIVEVTTGDGRWLGGGLVQCRSGRRSDLYEAGYTNAVQRAEAHGLRLDRYTATN